MIKHLSDQDDRILKQKAVHQKDVANDILKKIQGTAFDDHKITDY